jgi:4-alpha-glucanotransferase
VADARRWGIAPGYHDVAGAWHAAPRETVEALLDAMGANDDEPPPGPAIVAAPGRPHPHLPPGGLELENGDTLPVAGDLPYDLPLGYHRYVGDDGTETPLIVSPGQCWLPEGLRAWGWAAQLYAARSRSSWGMGDLADLRRLGEWSAAQGAGVALINPLHAPSPVEGQQPSPYFASSRCFRNPLYLRVEEVPGAERLAELPALAAAGRALNGDRTIDRDAVWRLKSAALEAVFADFPGDDAFDRYVQEQGAALQEYATFCALSECHGIPWEKWPSEVRQPDGAGIAAFMASRAGAPRIRYHTWLQWLIDNQLRAAGRTIGLVQDLAIGADAGGADAWRWQGCTALGVRVGAPPDEFNVAGQNWALPPFDPWKLRAAGYQPFIELVRAGLRGAGGMRFDHVMGLFRLFWIPAEGTPADGTYVQYPAQDLLDILALESQRANAFIVGEDLGTVEDEVRAELEARRVLSYRLLWFEPTPPDGGQWPRQALAAATTHDLPTVAGVWTGRDLEARRGLGLAINEEAEARLRAKLAAWLDADDTTPVPEVVERVYRLLGRAPSALLTAALDDALAVEERPNLPGTLDEWPNWRIALPAPLEEIETAPLAQSIADSLNRS